MTKITYEKELHGNISRIQIDAEPEAGHLTFTFYYRDGRKSDYFTLYPESSEQIATFLQTAANLAREREPR